MGKTVIAVNAGPRKGWNTDTLIADASSGAEFAGAEVKSFDLYRLERYAGCISCFGCKRERSKGHCVCRDGLTPVLDAIREADGLIIGSPNYLGELTASFRALYERLVLSAEFTPKNQQATGCPWYNGCRTAGTSSFPSRCAARCLHR